MCFDLSRVRGDILLKQKYISTSYENKILSEAEILNRISVFNKIAAFEEIYNKDIYDFSLPELEITLNGLGELENISLASKVSFLKEYVKFALLNEKPIYSEPTILTLKNKDLNEFLSTNKRDLKYITRKELFKIIEQLRNFQDKALLLLIFKGILGNACMDLINLKVSDFDFENRVINFEHYFKPKGAKKGVVESENRSITLTHEEAYIVMAAIKEDVYISPKSPNHKLRKTEETEILLQDSEYIFKKNNTRKTTDDPKVSQELIRQRLTWCRDVFKNDMVKASNLNLAGFVYDLLQEKEEWTKRELHTLSLKRDVNFSFKTLESAYNVLKKKYELEAKEELEKENIKL